MKVGMFKIRFIHCSTSDCQDLLGRRLVVRVGTSMGSTISHMAAVHPGHQLPEALQKIRRRTWALDRRERSTPRCGRFINEEELRYAFYRD